ncbi:hypothetical protein D0869_06411 [Hortaea werneckii]|uniref:Uncharacterized protein n=1 Tax=Hortaea werneckii TaxID=91943 RepID=A0A3M6WUF8_HORWE|nr:NAD(P)-binding protein [Hortaea werneckii]KAI7593623.1 NAD(P)-binding protein [Hortaea werneckii]RMX81960.1 hypothetical protein D0869_06411 [Hortaea werneckii]RMY06011.1 hypothetical protein D0868_06096 [Hortaea werneckii]
MLRLDGKVALVVGSGQGEGKGRGIGAACAIVLAKQGAVVFGGNRTVASADATRNKIISEGGKCEVMATDATDAVSVAALVQACKERHGRIDILLNSVGRSEPGCPVRLSPETWESQMAINLRSIYLTCHYVLPIMEAQGSGSIVSVGSIAGLRSIGKAQVGYHAAKAALLQFTKATAVIYAPKGIRLNTVVPGLMETPYTQQMADRYARDYASFKAQRERQVPMGRMGDAWDVAHAALFLVSDMAQYITGQEIIIDGGMTVSTGAAHSF